MKFDPTTSLRAAFEFDEQLAEQITFGTLMSYNLYQASVDINECLHWHALGILDGSTLDSAPYGVIGAVPIVMTTFCGTDAVIRRRDGVRRHYLPAATCIVCSTGIRAEIVTRTLQTQQQPDLYIRHNAVNLPLIGISPNGPYTIGSSSHAYPHTTSSSTASVPPPPVAPPPVTALQKLMQHMGIKKK